MKHSSVYDNCGNQSLAVFPRDPIHVNEHKTYQQRAKELKEKLYMIKTDKKDKKNRSICVKSCYNLNIQLKCKENGKFVAKRKAIHEMFVEISTDYDTIHIKSREHFGIKHTNTFLSNFNNETLESSMTTFGDLLSLQKERKKKH